MNKSMSAFAALAVLFFAPLALAMEAEDVIKYRKSVMKSVGGHFGAARLIVLGKVSYGSDLASHAMAIAAALRDVPALFPPDSDFADTPTRALQAVWDKRSDFEQVAADAGKAADAFAQAVQAGEKGDLKPRLSDLLDSCKACHKDFRQEDE